VRVVEARPDLTGEPKQGVITGRGTEAETLMQADIETAGGLIAGTDNDANNLSIVVTARFLNPDLFIVLRQNHSDNSSIIDAVKADMVMHPSQIIADKIRVLLGTPMLHRFISLAYHQENEWACELVSRISALVGRCVPELEEVRIDDYHAEAVTDALDEGEHVRIGELLHDSWQRDRQIRCIVLMIQREQENILLPPADMELRPGDRLLVCAGRGGIRRLYWNMQNAGILSYVRTGEVRTYGWCTSFHSLPASISWQGCSVTGCFIVTSSSALLGWMATVRSKSALVAPIFTATAKPCIISSALSPMMWMPTTFSSLPAQISFSAVVTPCSERPGSAPRAPAVPSGRWWPPAGGRTPRWGCSRSPFSLPADD